MGARTVTKLLLTPFAKITSERLGLKYTPNPVSDLNLKRQAITTDGEILKL